MKRILHSLALMMIAVGVIGCTHDYRIGLEMQPANEATVIVEGDNPLVTVTNRGPGAVMIDFGLGGAMELNANTATGRTVRGSTTIMLHTGAESGASVSVSASNAEGISIEQSPSPISE